MEHRPIKGIQHCWSLCRDAQSLVLYNQEKNAIRICMIILIKCTCLIEHSFKPTLTKLNTVYPAVIFQILHQIGQSTVKHPIG